VSNGRLNIQYLKKKQTTTTKRNIEARPSFKTFSGLIVLAGCKKCSSLTLCGNITAGEGLVLVTVEKFCQIEGI